MVTCVKKAKSRKRQFGPVKDAPYSHGIYRPNRAVTHLSGPGNETGDHWSVSRVKGGRLSVTPWRRAIGSWDYGCSMISWEDENTENGISQFT